MHYLLKRRPTVVLAELWDGPGAFLIPSEHTLHDAVLYVSPGDYIVKRTYDDWYPLAASVAAQDYEVVKEMQADAVYEVGA